MYNIKGPSLSRAVSLEFKLTISDFSALAIGGRRVYMSGAKLQGNFYGLVLDRLKRSADVYRKLTQLFDSGVVNELCVCLFGTIEYYAHNCLTGPNWTIGLYMNLVDTHGFSFSNECVKNILAEIFSLNDDLLFFRVLLKVIRSECVDAVGHL